jgi:hypothetical protein
MFSLQRCADQLLLKSSPEERKIWVSLSQATAKDLAGKFEQFLKDRAAVGSEDEHPAQQKQMHQAMVWQIMYMFIAHGGDLTKRLLREKIGELAKICAAKQPNDQVIGQFLYLLG